MNRYRILFEQSPNAVLYITPEGGITDFNPAALEFFAISQPELEAASIENLFANRSDFSQLIERAEVTGIVRNDPILFIDRLDRIKHGQVSIIGLDRPDEGGGGYLVLIQDITEHRQAEKELYCQKNYAEQLIELAPEAIVIIDLNGRLLRTNQEFLRLFQLTLETCTGNSIQELIVPEDYLAESISLMAQVFGGGNVEVETIRKKRDGTLVDVSILAAPISTAEDEPAIFVIFRDITKRKQAEKALIQSETRHRTVLEAAPDPVIVRDMDMRVIYLNPAFTRVFGWHLSEIMNQRIDFIPEESVPETQEFMEQIRKGFAFSGVETKRLSKTGRTVDVSISGAVFLDTEGKPEGFINTLQDISERRKKDEELRYVAYHDTLTGLPNRKSFYMRMDDLLHHSSRRDSDRAWALMLIDLDKFKQVNDTLGHDTGDQLLKGVADRLKSCIRESDHLFRLGGDEFTIILTQLNRDIDVTRVARKVLDAIGRPFRCNGNEIFTSTSIGISIFPNDGWDAAGLLKNADMAMYSAKESGGRGFQFFTKEMNQKALHRMKMESSLRKALERDELLLYYQPLVNGSHRIVGMEALLRWRHPEYGLVLPADFIRITEETGIIVSMGQWVLETAATQVKQLHEMGFSDLVVSVNVAARQLQEPDFEQLVMQTLEKMEVTPKCMRLEVTESSVIQNLDVVIPKMKNLRKKGITFSIDDFGTGYSSLSYLKRFPIDVLKIDRSFIVDAMKSTGDQEIIKTIISMARNLNLDTVAEGVETLEQKSFLIRNGCGSMQGFLFSPPVSMDQFKALLSRDNPYASLENDIFQ